MFIVYFTINDALLSSRKFIVHSPCYSPVVFLFKNCCTLKVEWSSYSFYTLYIKLCYINSDKCVI